MRVLRNLEDEKPKEYIKKTEYFKIGEKTTICLLTLKNGFEIVGQSACVNFNDFDEEIGQIFALQDAKRLLEGFEGYRKQQELFELQE